MLLKSTILCFLFQLCMMDIVESIEEIVVPEIDDSPDTLVTVDSVTELDI